MKSKLYGLDDYKKKGNVRTYNLTLRRVRVTILVVEKQ